MARGQQRHLANIEKNAWHGQTHITFASLNHGWCQEGRLAEKSHPPEKVQLCTWISLSI